MEITGGIPRAEYPRPQWVRERWLCLNGPWQFEVDAGDSGLERGLGQRELKQTIVVPFCPESSLSGLCLTDFLEVVWYRREVRIPSEWAGQRILLHFQAVDHDATVWVNGGQVGRHRGGWTPFTCDITGAARAGQTASIVVRARDDHRAAKPLGKQSQRYENYGCHYTRTTGIWQTVWLEAVPMRAHLLRPRIASQRLESFQVLTPVAGERCGLSVRVALCDAAGPIATATVPADADFQPAVTLSVPSDRRRAWSPSDPHLYDLEIALLDRSGAIVDRAKSYTGLRSVTLDGRAVKLNGQAIFQRLVLDQGYYPDGIMTAPSDEALRRDIQLSLDAGFNGARLHQKVFEERFLYHADHLGYLVWGEFGDWGIDRGDPKATYVGQWLEVLQRDYSHPCIVGWCALNETAESVSDRISGLDDLTLALFLAAKAMDQTRPVLDASGYAHRVAESDVWDCHDYEQDPREFEGHHRGTSAGKPYVNGAAESAWSIEPRGSKPFMVSEFGGIWCPPAPPGSGQWQQRQSEQSWGYGRAPANAEEFHARFEGLCSALLKNPGMFGYCYTQLTDVFQEQNGIYAFDRTPKLDLARLRAAQRGPAAIESPDSR